LTILKCVTIEGWRRSFVTNEVLHKVYGDRSILRTTRQAMSESRNTETLLCNRCCSEKSIRNTYSECACVVLGIQDVKSMGHKIICDLFGSTICFHIIA